VTWWRGNALLDDDYFTTPKGVVRNVLKIAKLMREDLMMVLTCQASNTNLTVPGSQTFALDLNRKSSGLVINVVPAVIDDVDQVKIK